MGRHFGKKSNRRKNTNIQREKKDENRRGVMCGGEMVYKERCRNTCHAIRKRVHRSEVGVRP